MKVPELPEKPVDGFTIEWWSFEPADSYDPGLRRHLAIYIENQSWEAFVAREDLRQYHAHRPGERPGAPFIDNWIMVNQSGDKMHFDGRNDGWKWPLEKRGTIGGVESAKARWAEAYATPKEALEAFRAHAKAFIERKEEQIVRARESLDRIIRRVDPYSLFPIGTEVRLRKGTTGVPAGSEKETAKVIGYVHEAHGGLTLDGRLGGLQHWNADEVEPVSEGA